MHQCWHRGFRGYTNRGDGIRDSHTQTFMRTAAFTDAASTNTPETAKWTRGSSLLTVVDRHRHTDTHRKHIHTYVTLGLMLQWQHTVYRYLRVLHSRIMKRPPKNVTMEEARNAHHMRCPLLSQGTSDENGMTTSSILDMKIEESLCILLELILFVLIELPLPRGTGPPASASIEAPWRVRATVPSPTRQPCCLGEKNNKIKKNPPPLHLRFFFPTGFESRVYISRVTYESFTGGSTAYSTHDNTRELVRNKRSSVPPWREAFKSAAMTNPPHFSFRRGFRVSEGERQHA